MATARNTAPAAAGAPTDQVETETVAAPAEIVPVGTLLDQAQRVLVELITDAVSETGHGVDITLAQQAANVYKTLFGESA